MIKIGIIGVGFVGDAIRKSLAGKATLVLRDLAKDYTASYSDMLDCEAVFVCVPTPQRPDGTCHTTPLSSVLEDLDDVFYSGTIISKCTAPPTAYGQLQSYYTNLVHVPEFLTAANAADDYVNGEFAFIGGKSVDHLAKAERVVRLSQPRLVNVHFCSIAEASLAKYTINSFLATKVAFMNEIEAMAVKLGCSYNTIASMVKLDPRIGTSHMQVPGPDGAYGFGGACFPKDTAALLAFADQLDLSMEVVAAAVHTNIALRAKK